MTRAGLILMALLVVWFAARATLAAQAERWPAHLRFEAGTLHIDASLEDFANAQVRERLSSGLPQVLELRAEARTSTTLARLGRSCDVLYDLWEGVYRLREVTFRGADSEPRELRLSSVDAVVQACLRMENEPIGRAEDYQDNQGEAVEVALTARLNPPTPESVHRIRRWLARPGGAAEPGDTFFGSFVGLFVNRSVTDAEAVLEGTTAEIVVP